MALPQFAGRFGGGTVTLPTGLSYRTVSTMEQSISTAFPYVFQLVSCSRMLASSDVVISLNTAKPRLSVQIGGLAGGQLAERYGRVMPLNVVNYLTR